MFLHNKKNSSSVPPGNYPATDVSVTKTKLGDIPNTTNIGRAFIMIKNVKSFRLEIS